MAATPKGIVYTLTDPRDGAIRYVGKTIKSPLERLAQHLGSPTNPAMRVWLASLGGQGLLPRMDTIATVAADKLDGEEARLIKKHAKDGHRLLNAPYYHANLADLGDRPSAGKLPISTRNASELETAVDALRHRLYGRIAAARAADELPPTAAAARALLLAPILALGALVMAVTHTWFGRRCLGVSGACWYAWSIGFDHAVRSLVLAHLPVAAVVSFWREYLARPVETLGWQAAASALVMAWSSYAGVAEAAKRKAATTKRLVPSAAVSALSAPRGRA